jgi:IS30 family transposase
VPTPAPDQTPGKDLPATPAPGGPIGASFTPAERSVIINGIASGTPIAQLARALGRPRHHIDRWATRHQVHIRRPHSNRLVVQLAVALLGAGLPARAVATLAGLSGPTVTRWARTNPVPSPADFDAAQIRFYTALLSGVTPLEAAASAGESLRKLDPDLVYSADVSTPVAQQNPIAVSSTTAEAVAPVEREPHHPLPVAEAPMPKRRHRYDPAVTPGAGPASGVSAGSCTGTDAVTAAGAGPGVGKGTGKNGKNSGKRTVARKRSARRERKLATIAATKARRRTTDHQNPQETGQETGPGVATGEEEATDQVKRVNRSGDASRANRAGHRAAAKPSRRRGRHSLPEPEELTIPEPVTADPPPAIVRDPDPLTPLSPRFLSITDRETIALMLLAGQSQSTIAKKLGRARSTISREIRNNSTLDGTYCPYTAGRKAAGRRARPKMLKVFADPQLWAIVSCWLDEHRLSPEQISHRLKKMFPDRKELHVSHEAIYQALYVYPRGGLAREVKKALRTGRAVRKPRARTPQSPRPAKHKNMVMIAERPADIDDRAIPGDWEGDLICGEHNQSAIGTLVERRTRYVMLLHLPGAHDALSVRDAMVARIAELPEQISLSVTWDQGAEMALHEDVSTTADIDVYFCDPHAPWQRGTNENTNGLLRQFFPKSTDLSGYTVEDLRDVERLMNNRPRKALDWSTPAEAIWEELDDILEY